MSTDMKCALTEQIIIIINESRSDSQSDGQIEYGQTNIQTYRQEYNQRDE